MILICLFVVNIDVVGAGTGCWGQVASRSRFCHTNEKQLTFCVMLAFLFGGVAHLKELML